MIRCGGRLPDETCDHALACGMTGDSLTARLVKILRADPDVMHVLVTLRGLALPDWRLVSGAIYQSVWNVLTDKPRGHGIKCAEFEVRDIDWIGWLANFKFDKHTRINLF
jgi:hypothetical protein